MLANWKRYIAEQSRMIHSSAFIVNAVKLPLLDTDRLNATDQASLSLSRSFVRPSVRLLIARTSAEHLSLATNKGLAADDQVLFDIFDSRETERYKENLEISTADLFFIRWRERSSAIEMLPHCSSYWGIDGCPRQRHSLIAPDTDD